MDRDAAFSRFRSDLETARDAAEAADALCVVSSLILTHQVEPESQRVVDQIADLVLSESRQFAQSDEWKKQVLLFWDDVFASVNAEFQQLASAQVVTFATMDDESAAIRRLAIRIACGLCIDGFPDVVEQIRVRSRGSSGVKSEVDEAAAELKWSLPRYYEAYFDRPAPGLARGVALARALGTLIWPQSKSRRGRSLVLNDTSSVAPPTKNSEE